MKKFLLLLSSIAITHIYAAEAYYDDPQIVVKSDQLNLQNQGSKIEYAAYLSRLPLEQRKLLIDFLLDRTEKVSKADPELLEKNYQFPDYGYYKTDESNEFDGVTYKRCTLKMLLIAKDPRIGIKFTDKDSQINYARYLEGLPQEERNVVLAVMMEKINQIKQTSLELLTKRYQFPFQGEFKCDIDDTPFVHCTPLMFAIAETHNPNVVQALIKKGCDPNLHEEKAYNDSSAGYGSPLGEALNALQCDEENLNKKHIVQILFAHGASVPQLIIEYRKKSNLNSGGQLGTNKDICILLQEAGCLRRSSRPQKRKREKDFYYDDNDRYDHDHDDQPVRIIKPRTNTMMLTEK